MRAIRISRGGGPEVLEPVEDAPVPGPSDAGVDSTDTHGWPAGR